MTDASYLSDDWFKIIRDDVFPNSFTPDFAVEVRTTIDNCEVRHVQLYLRGRLVGWERAGSRTSTVPPAVALHRPFATCLLDLTGGARDSELFNATSVSVPQMSEVRTDALGVGSGLVRTPFPISVPDLKIVALLRLDGEPFGTTTMGLSVGRNVVALSAPDESADVTIEAPYLAVLTWLHQPSALLGHLISTGTPVIGEMGAISALEGVVSAPSGDLSTGAWTHTMTLGLVNYALARGNPSTASAVRQVRARTSAYKPPAVHGVEGDSVPNTK